MLLADVVVEGRRRLAVRLGDGPVLDATEVGGANTIAGLLRRHGGMPARLDLAAAEPLELAGARVGAIGDDASRYFCVGLNYAAHASEVDRRPPSHPTLFLRTRRSLVGHGTPIVAPQVSDQLDYEGEVAVVIGRPARHVTPTEALAHVAGITAMAENSVRDWQQHTPQVTPGKNFDASGSIGPWLAVGGADRLDELAVTTRLNGAQVQHGLLGDVLFDVPTVISYLSGFTELQPGDVIATGTPDGIGYRRSPQRFLRSGDVLEVEVTGLPVLRNSVVAEGVPPRRVADADGTAPQTVA